MNTKPSPVDMSEKRRLQQMLKPPILCKEIQERVIISASVNYSFLSVVDIYTLLRLTVQFSAGKVVILVSAVVVNGADDGVDARSKIADVAHKLIGQFLPVGNHLILTCRDGLELGVVFIRPLLIQRNEVASELRDVGGGRLPGDGVRGGVEVDQKLVFQAFGTERKTPVGRIDGEALVGEGRRDHLGNERADPGQSHLVVPDDQFTYHP